MSVEKNYKKGGKKMKIGVSVWRVLCKETKLKLLQNAMQESKSRFTKHSLSIAIKQQKGEV
jgi:hypothetical protein